MTNWENIKNMTEAEFADWISEYMPCQYCKFAAGVDECCDIGCYKGKEEPFTEWLKSDLSSKWRGPVD